MDHRIFNMHTDNNACTFTQGCTDTARQSELKVDREKNPLPHYGIQPALAACPSNTLPTELYPHPVNFSQNWQDFWLLCQHPSWSNQINQTNHSSQQVWMTVLKFRWGEEKQCKPWKYTQSAVCMKDKKIKKSKDTSSPRNQFHPGASLPASLAALWHSGAPPEFFPFGLQGHLWRGSWKSAKQRWHIVNVT